MGGCEGVDLSQKVMCCAGKVQVLVLASIFLLSAFATGGLVAWQIEELKKGKPDMNALYIYMVVPGLMFLTAICLFAMLKINPKVLLIICIAWPVISSSAPAFLTYILYKTYKEIADKYSSSSAIKLMNASDAYLFYFIPAAAALYILCAIYCIVLIVCLAFCQRSGAGRDHDLYELESEINDKTESSTKSHLSIE